MFSRGAMCGARCDTRGYTGAFDEFGAAHERAIGDAPRRAGGEVALSVRCRVRGDNDKMSEKSMLYADVCRRVRELCV